MWLRDTGILDKLNIDVLNPPIPIPDPKLRHKQPLILRQLGIIMIILVVGLAFAINVYILELWLKGTCRTCATLCCVCLTRTHAT